MRNTANCHRHTSTSIMCKKIRADGTTNKKHINKSREELVTPPHVTQIAFQLFHTPAIPSLSKSNKYSNYPPASPIHKHYFFLPNPTQAQKRGFHACDAVTR